MKRRILLIAGILLLSIMTIYTQDQEVITVQKEVGSFKALEFGDALNVFIEQGDQYELKVETFPAFQNKFDAIVKNDVLKLNFKSKKNPDILNVYINFPDIEKIQVEGAANLNSRGLIQLDYLNLICGGASDVDLELEINELISEIHGASDVTLKGSCNAHISEIHGASDFDGNGFTTEDAQLYVHGASNASVLVNKKIVAKIEGAAALSYSGDPEYADIDKSSAASVYTNKNYYNDENDTVQVNIGKIRVEVYEDDDSTKVIVGDLSIKAGEDGDVVIKKLNEAKRKFNGHWAGFGIGVNGYLSPDYRMDFPVQDEYLDLRLGKSMAVHLNLFEQNISLLKCQKMGFTTGLGLTWNNYRFLNKTRIEMEDGKLTGYIMEDVKIKKTKLTSMYLSVPLILEFQTGKSGFRDFYIAAGVLGNLRLSSHTKIYYNELEKDIYLSKYNEELEDYETNWMVTTPDKNKVKNFDDFYLNPFRIDATARIGWGFIELFGTYSLTPMFRDNKAPELIPWTIGLTLADF